MDADGTLKPIHAVFQVYIILSILYYAIDTCLGTDRNAKLRRFFAPKRETLICQDRLWTNIGKQRPMHRRNASVSESVSVLCDDLFLSVIH